MKNENKFSERLTSLSQDPKQRRFAIPAVGLVAVGLILSGSNAPYWLPGSFVLLGIGILLYLSFSGAGDFHVVQPVRRPVGINLARYSNWSSEFLFKDVFKSCQPWITFNADDTAPWDTGLEIPATETGYPEQVPFSIGGSAPQMARTLLFWGETIEYPAGDYTLFFEGTGLIRIRLQGGTWQEYNSSGETFSADGRNGIMIEIRESIIDHPIRNIRFVMPGFEGDYEADPFYPPLLEFLEDFDCIRFMDLMRTNWSPVVFWAGRNRPDYYSQTLSNGVAYEYLVDLCNRTQKDAWVNIPHQIETEPGEGADYLQEFATYLRDNLHEDLNVYVEYSNEVWNDTFRSNDINGYGQRTLAEEEGNTAYPHVPNEHRRSLLYYTRRSAHVFQAFTDVFAGPHADRLVRVLAGHSAVPDNSQFIIDNFRADDANGNYVPEDPADPVNPYNPTNVSFDAFAIAPYVGRFVANSSFLEWWGNHGSITEEVLLNRIRAELEEGAEPVSVYDEISRHKDITRQAGIRLLAYEAGQHLVTVNNVPPIGPMISAGEISRAEIESIEPGSFNSLLHATNRNNEMEDLYCDYLRTWYTADNNKRGELLMHFSSHEIMSHNGSYGLKEYMEQAAEETPKYRAFRRCVFNVNAFFE